MHKLPLGMITSLLLINQAYAWKDACIFMAPGIGFAGWIEVFIYDKEQVVSTIIGPWASMCFSSCVDLDNSVAPGTEMEIWLYGPRWTLRGFDGVMCAKVKANQSCNTITYNGNGVLWNKICEKP